MVMVSVMMVNVRGIFARVSAAAALLRACRLRFGEPQQHHPPKLRDLGC